jgi:hypothetical protein
MTLTASRPIGSGRSDFILVVRDETTTFCSMHKLGFIDTLTTREKGKATRYRVSLNGVRELVFKEKKSSVLQRLSTIPHPPPKAPSHHRKCTDQQQNKRGSGGAGSSLSLHSSAGPQP